MGRKGRDTVLQKKTLPCNRWQNKKGSQQTGTSPRGVRVVAHILHPGPWVLQQKSLALKTNGADIWVSQSAIGN